MVNVNKYVGSCNTLDDRSNKVCIPNEIEDLSWHVFNMITGTNESRTLTKHISFKYECQFDSKKCNLNQKWNNHGCQCKSENPK